MAQLATPKSVLLSGDRLSVVGFESHYYSNSSSTSANSKSSGALRFIHNKHKPNFSSNRGGFTFTVHATMSSNNNNYINDMNSERSSTTSSPGNSNRIFDEILEDDDELSEFYIDNNELSSFRGLVLDISYRPVNVVCWKRAICLEFMDKADVLEYYDQTVNSCSGSFYIPAVLRVPHLLQVVKRRKVKRGLSRKNILSRDNFTCQYCSSIENLTIDHVLPIARGGKWTWENLVTACAKCNSKKGHKTLEEVNMELMKIPKAPKDYDLLAIPLTNHAIKLLRNRKEMPEEWQQYLSKPFLAP